jgi:hypothetical protein
MSIETERALRPIVVASRGVTAVALVLSAAAMYVFHTLGRELNEGLNVNSGIYRLASALDDRQVQAWLVIER